MAQGDNQRVRARKVRTPPEIEARLKRVLPGLKLRGAEGVIPLNPGFFKLEEMRKGEIVKRKADQKKQLKGK